MHVFHDTHMNQMKNDRLEVVVFSHCVVHASACCQEMLSKSDGNMSHPHLQKTPMKSEMNVVMGWRQRSLDKCGGSCFQSHFKPDRRETDHRTEQKDEVQQRFECCCNHTAVHSR